MAFTNRQDMVIVPSLTPFRSGREGEIDMMRHFAHMMALLGAPPEKFRKGSTECSKYWDDIGELTYSFYKFVIYNWSKLIQRGNRKCSVAIDDWESFGFRERNLDGKEKAAIPTHDARNAG